VHWVSSHSPFWGSEPWKKLKMIVYIFANALDSTSL